MKTVIHLTSTDTADRGHAKRCASLLFEHDDLVHDDVTFLPHGMGSWLVTPVSENADEIADLSERGVSIKAGATCFDTKGHPREVLPGVEIVSSGVSELVRLQSEGYNYVKIP